MEKENNIYDFYKRTNIFYAMELILMSMPMQGMKKVKNVVSFNAIWISSSPLYWIYID